MRELLVSILELGMCKAEAFPNLISNDSIELQERGPSEAGLEAKKYFNLDLPAPINSVMTISEYKGQTIFIGNTHVVIEI